MPWKHAEGVHRWVRKRVGTILLALATASYRGAQELGYFPKDIILFPLLVIIFVLFVLYAVITSDIFSVILGKFYERLGKDHRMAAYGIVVLCGAFVGGALAVGGYRLFEIHKKHMQILSKPASVPPAPQEPIKAQPAPPQKEKPSAGVIPKPHPPKEIPTPLSKGPRLGIGPDAYKDLDDVQVGQWAIEEADKISEMAKDCINKSIADMKEKHSGNAPRWFFTNDFKKCCLQDVIDLRTEILRRLGPPGKDPQEESYFSYMRSEHQGILDPMMVQTYAPYLKKLGMKLKRRSVPRAAPRELRFTEQQVSPEKPEFPYKILITVHTDKEIKAGYIVIQWSGNWGIIHGHDLEDGTSLISTSDIIDNEPLSKFLEANRDPLPYPIHIGKMPFSPNKPMHVLASNNKPFHAARVTLFDE